MKPTVYIVAYKDSEQSRVLYFGPFVSDSVAHFFQAALPGPCKGGWARTLPLQPFTANEAHIVSRSILTERRKVAA